MNITTIILVNVHYRDNRILINNNNYRVVYNKKLCKSVEDYVTRMFILKQYLMFMLNVVAGC